MDIEKLGDYHYSVFCGDVDRATKFKEYFQHKIKNTDVTVEVVASLTEVKEAIKAVNEAFV